MSNSLITKYRPETFDGIVGHSAQVRALENAISKKLARAFLFTGPSGVGKTTLARITAKELGCLPENILEVDAATNTGIDAMREVTEGLQWRPLSGSSKGIIVDEQHALSKSAAQSLLKILEDPPSHVYWFLCTTEPGKVLPTIKTRCLCVDLKPVGTVDLISHLEGVAEAEEICGTSSGQKIIELCAQEAGGSPRQALSNLALCSAANTLDEAKELLSTAMEEVEAIELARALFKGAGWKEVQGLLRKLKDSNPESVRHVVQAYATTVILNANNKDDAGFGAEILDAFSTPFNSFDKMSPLVMACCRVVFSS